MSNTPLTDEARKANVALGWGSCVEIPEGAPNSDPWELCAKLEVALTKACTTAFKGDCPRHIHNVEPYGDCSTRCHDDIDEVQCWKQYFMRDVSKEKTKNGAAQGILRTLVGFCMCLLMSGCVGIFPLHTDTDYYLKDAQYQVEIEYLTREVNFLEWVNNKYRCQLHMSCHINKKPPF